MTNIEALIEAQKLLDEIITTMTELQKALEKLKTIRRRIDAERTQS